MESASPLTSVQRGRVASGTRVPCLQSNSDHSHTEHRIPRTLLSTPHMLTHLILPTTTWGRSYNRPLTDEAAETQWWTGHRLCIHTQVRVYISVCIHVFITLRPRILCFPCMCSLKPHITYKDLWFCFPDEETMVQRCVMMCPSRRSLGLSITML